MSKDPAFLFYPNDWLGGTMGMTAEQKGCYIDLLIFQFNNHHFTEAQAKQVLSICFASVWEVLKNKFKKDGQFYFNERLRDEINKRKSFTESRRINALHPKKTRKAYAKHMGNENEDENRDINNRFKVPSIEEITSYCQERKNKVNPDVWLNHYESNGWMVGKNKMKDWKAAVRTWEKTNFESIPVKPIKQESPYENCPRCGKELRKGYEYTIIGGQKCCEYCPEARVQAKQMLDNLNIKSL